MVEHSPQILASEEKVVTTIFRTMQIFSPGLPGTLVRFAFYVLCSHSSGESRRMEEIGCKITCGALTTMAGKG